MFKKLRKLKLGYISIEVVILASIILVSGFSFLGAFVKNGQSASNDAANKIDSVLELAGGGSGELPGGGLPGGGSLGDDFPIEWNTREASNNVSFVLIGPDGEIGKLVKVSNFLPTEEQLNSTKCTSIQSGDVMDLAFYQKEEDTSFFAYGVAVQGFVVEKIGTNIFGESMFEASEPGLYVLDLYDFFGQVSDFVIDIPAPEILPTSFPVEWNTKEASDNVSFTIEGSKLVKVGDFLPTEEQLSSAKCTSIQSGDVTNFDGYYDVVEGLSFFSYGYVVQGIIAKGSGEYDMGAGATLSIPEPGLYVLDIWGMMGEDLDFVIDIPEPPSFPIEWNTLEAAENNPAVEVWGSGTDIYLTKVSDMIPTTEEFLTTKLVENYNGSTHNFNLRGYQQIDEAVVYFEYECDGYGSLWGAIVKGAGYSDYFEAEFQEPGIYVNHYNDDEIEYSINSHEVSSSFVPGLYESGSIAAYMNNGAAALEGKLIMSFYDLLDESVVYIAGGSLVHIERGPMSLRETYHCVLQGDLFLPDIGIISNKIFEYTFRNCNSITGILVPEGATSIGGLSFTGASSLKTIVLPKSLEFIGYGAFNETAPLVDVYYAGTESEWNTIEIDEENQELLNATIHFNSRISK